VPGYDQQQPFVQAACLIDLLANSFRLSKPHSAFTLAE
jgi:hypothetical protein